MITDLIPDEGGEDGAVAWALDELKRRGYRVFLGREGLWMVQHPYSGRWMPPVDDRRLVNRAATLPP